MKKKILITLNIVALLALGGAAGFFFKKYNDLKNDPQSAQQVAQDQADRTIAEVGKSYDLPKDEKPSVATVNDKEKLKDQPFFAKAENGDVTLIYSKAKLAILYRPSTKKVINVSTVSIQDSLRVKVIGSATARQSVMTALQAAQISAEEGGEAKSTPTAVTVVDLSGQNSEQAKKVAETIKGSVGTLPAGEDKPEDVDILIVAGP